MQLVMQNEEADQLIDRKMPSLLKDRESPGMRKLIYVSPMSLDGYLGDMKYDWSIPSEASTAFITEVIRPIGTYLYGRRNYETMGVWDSPEFVSTLTGSTNLEFARVWQAADKVIYSKTLGAVSTKKTRLERNFDPEAIRKMKASSPNDLCVGGANLAAQAIRAGLVDEIHLLVVPATLGGGISVLPRDYPLHLELLQKQKVGDGWVSLRYRPKV